MLKARIWLSRSFSTVSSNPLRVCVVGSGPAGFYTAEKVNPYFVSIHNFILFADCDRSLYLYVCFSSTF